MELTNKKATLVEQKQKPKKPGVWDQLVLALIRPPKHTYNPQQLGRLVHNIRWQAHPSEEQLVSPGGLEGASR